MIHKLAESFISVQGEASFVGRRSFFIRYAFCNLNCSFCDTPQKAKVEHVLTTDEIVQKTKEEDVGHIVITGGEPLLYIDNIVDIVNSLPNHTTFEIETNGTLLDLDNPLIPNQRVYFNVSPKVEFESEYKKGLAILYDTRQIFKFPINKQNIGITREFIEKYEIPKDRVYYMPICKNYTEYVLVADWVLEQALQDKVNFSPRLHLIQNVK